MFGFWGGNVFDIKDARHDLVDVPSRPRSRLMNAYSGTKLATARNRLRSLSADGQCGQLKRYFLFCTLLTKVIHILMIFLLLFFF